MRPIHRSQLPATAKYSKHREIFPDLLSNGGGRLIASESVLKESNRLSTGLSLEDDMSPALGHAPCLQWERRHRGEEEQCSQPNYSASKDRSVAASTACATLRRRALLCDSAAAGRITATRRLATAHERTPAVFDGRGSLRGTARPTAAARHSLTVLERRPGRLRVFPVDRDFSPVPERALPE